MRALGVVDAAPGVEGGLGLAEAREGSAVQDLGLERAMEALVFALRLRMVGTAMADPDTQSEQPHAEGRVGLRGRGPTPRAAVIHQHLIG